jgi:serine/threonine protein phosphatase 1
MSIIASDRVKHFGLNTDGRDFIVGDIHGCFTQLKKKLEDVSFNEKIDRLFAVGDLVDRGLESKRCLEWLAKPWFHAVRGNHEEIFIHFCLNRVDSTYMIQVGGHWAITMPSGVRDEYVEAFTKLPIAIDVETTQGLVGIVHAECPEPSWQEFVDRITSCSHQELEQLKNECLWSRKQLKYHLQTTYADVYKIVVGHSIVNQPSLLGNVQYIDTGAAYGRYLTVINLI